jgi:LysR family transcriptional activator of nhaA
MNPWINYHHLYYFKTIAEEESVSKAAAKLRLGQPTLSAQLKQFEENLGVSLFQRQHKKLVLTDQGKIALDYARNIFKMGSEMYEVLHDRLLPQRLSVHIGALDSVSKQVILRLVEAALAIAPCQISLAEGKSDELIRELSSHRIDLLLTNFLPTTPDARGLFHRVITKNSVSVYASPKFKLLRKGFPRSISGQPFIVPTYDSRLRLDIDHWSRTNDIYFDIVAESQDIAVKKLMAVNGIGMIFAAPHTVGRQVANGKLLKIGRLTGVYEELLLVTAQRKIANPVAAKLMAKFSV